MILTYPVLLLGALSATLIISAYTDIIRGRVYNWCTYPAMFVGLAAGYIPKGPIGLLDPALGLLVGVGLFILPYSFRLVGAGDVKLMGAVGALAAGVHGPEFVLLVTFLSAVIGAIFGMSILIWQGKLGGAFGNIGQAMFTPWRLKHTVAADETRVPYGVAIAAGTFWALFVAKGIL